MIVPTAGAVGASGPTTLSFVDSSISTNNQITVPATAAEGDLCIITDYGTNTSSVTLPSGWTQAKATIFSGECIGQTIYKVLESGDPGSSITVTNGNTDLKQCLVFRPDVPITAVDHGTWNGVSQSGDPDAQTVTVSSLAGPLIVFGWAAQVSSTINFTTESPAFDATVMGSGSDSAVGYKIYNSSPSNLSLIHI